MSALLESILNGDYVSANEIFEQKMVELQEKKLIEVKKQIQAEMFGMTKAEIEAKKKAGYRKAADVLGDPRDIKIEPLVKTKKIKKKKVSEETLDEIKLPGDVAGSLSRKVAAKTIKLGRKYLGKDFSKRYLKSRTAEVEASKQEKEKQSAFPQDMHDTQSSAEKERPGRLARNLNTLMGRKPGYVKPEKSDDEKGGRVGWALRKTGKAIGFAGKVAAGVLQSAEE